MVVCYDKDSLKLKQVTKPLDESHYRWNGFNQLTVFTGKGKLGGRRYTWYYKYDGIGRRIEKACPEQNIKVRYVWDGDQLAYSETERQQRIDSCRHSVFHGWELLAQQDQYYDIEQTAEGGQLNWKNQTHYAVCQSNGQPLALFTPEGKPTWRKQPTALWGRLLNHRWAKYQPSEPLNPNLLFAGQYYDEESGLAYNRFRYYDPETANYLSSDPIGLNGGETPYSYVHNPWDWLDPFGLAGCLKNKVDGLAREKRAQDILERRYGKENVLRERILRDANGKKVLDPLTNSGRRVDFVVKGKDGVWRPIEITSKTAPKFEQLAKETRISSIGGTFVRNPITKELIPIEGISKVIRSK
ncbi:RHS repeat-associated core domain-containing protein [Pasteurella testudinis DSM 23072]|uniref:RHS repeat-associated core domain-containing protein n=1 Tax=Pasteurella testudinis DSM 23072 TaxID=1122938 RepID=A0A1W1V3N0_9PAST|nr:RHS repeat-associated core domain-containing protein [Pasteurella testudinis]SMB87932.1 RHS repeat-associated core domain-containing protein [Pasteurella testudinis DSM 23072]SUB52185.1 Cell wall-associated polypeptide CWBP200 [Pasteurella testudinis]